MISIALFLDFSPRLYGEVLRVDLDFATVLSLGTAHGPPKKRQVEVYIDHTVFIITNSLETAISS
jgi:hypothetical protein